MDKQSNGTITKPVIAVTGSDTRFPIAWWCTALTIWLLGGKPFRLTPSIFQSIKTAKLQGIVIGGGNDINPGLYGMQNDHNAKLDHERDIFEIEMINFALKHDIPLLGICRGSQLINVVLGGTLYPNIRLLRKNTSNFRTPFPRKTALLEKNTKLFGKIGNLRLRINSLHYQAIDKLGNNLRITAKDLDGFIQGIESTSHRFIIGTQWHPEYLFYLPSQRTLFEKLLKESSQTTPMSLHV